MTTLLAIYGALVATAALTLQVVMQWQTWAIRVEVQVSRMTLAQPQKPHEPVILFRLINHSGDGIKVTHLGMKPLRRGGKHLFFPQPLPHGVPGPFEIPPRDAITLYQTPISLGNADPGFKTRAIIATSDGKQFNSRRVKVREPLEDAAEESR